MRSGPRTPRGNSARASYGARGFFSKTYNGTVSPAYISMTALSSASPSSVHLKRSFLREARRLGASMIGFAPASRWAEYDEVPASYRPNEIWKPTQTVVVLAVPILLPILESTPSINYQEHYITSNILLDQLAYRLSIYLNDVGLGRFRFQGMATEISIFF